MLACVLHLNTYPGKSTLFMTNRSFTMHNPPCIPYARLSSVCLFWNTEDPHEIFPRSERMLIRKCFFLFIPFDKISPLVQVGEMLFTELSSIVRDSNSSAVPHRSPRERVAGVRGEPGTYIVDFVRGQGQLEV